jgi:hypothetical protein
MHLPLSLNPPFVFLIVVNVGFLQAGRISLDLSMFVGVFRGEKTESQRILCVVERGLKSGGVAGMSRSTPPGSSCAKNQSKTRQTRVRSTAKWSTT